MNYPPDTLSLLGADARQFLKRRRGLYVNATWQEAASGGTIEGFDPPTGKPFASPEAT